MGEGLVDNEQPNRLSEVDIVRFGEKVNHGLFCVQNEGLKMGEYTKGKESRWKRRGIKHLGYEEWRKRELERLVIYSGYRNTDKIQMLKELKDAQD